jgi:hypothetical protein
MLGAATRRSGLRQGATTTQAAVFRGCPKGSSGKSTSQRCGACTGATLCCTPRLALYLFSLERACQKDTNPVLTKGKKMQWYYRWKLKRIQKKITALKELSSYRLTEDYTASSQLRILTRLEAHLQTRLTNASTPSVQH